MFDEVDKQLEAWAKTVSPDLKVSFAAPDRESNERQVCLYLLDVIPEPLGRGSRVSLHQLNARYLVIPFSPDPIDCHRLLGVMMRSALDDPTFTVGKELLPVAMWSAFGIAPRPSFTLRVPCRYEREEKLAPPVRHPLTLRQTILESLQGRVLVNHMPTPNARIDIPSLNLSVSTDTDGRFGFTSVPTEPSEKHLLIKVKGRDFTVSTGQAARKGNEYLFDLKWEE